MCNQSWVRIAIVEDSWDSFPRTILCVLSIARPINLVHVCTGNDKKQNPECMGKTNLYI